MVFNPSAGADEALGPFPFFLQNNQYSVHLPIFPANDILAVFPSSNGCHSGTHYYFPHSNAWATHVDLVINWVHIVVL